MSRNRSGRLCESVGNDVMKKFQNSQISVLVLWRNYTWVLPNFILYSNNARFFGYRSSVTCSTPAASTVVTYAVNTPFLKTLTVPLYLNYHFWLQINLSNPQTSGRPVSVVSIATGYGLDGPGIGSRWGAIFFAPVQTGPGAHPASCTMGTGSFLEVKSGRGVTLTPHFLLVLWSWKSKAIPLLPLWAVRPVQSLSACTRVHFTFFTRQVSRQARLTAFGNKEIKLIHIYF